MALRPRARAYAVSVGTTLCSGVSNAVGPLSRDRELSGKGVGPDCGMRQVSASMVIRPFVSVGEQLPVDLYDGEEERGADTEQQHTVDRFQRADHLEPGRQRQTLYFKCGHGGQ